MIEEGVGREAKDQVTVSHQFFYSKLKAVAILFIFTVLYFNSFMQLFLKTTLLCIKLLGETNCVYEQLI